MEELTDKEEQEIQKFIDSFETDFEVVLEEKPNQQLLTRLYNSYVEEMATPSNEYYEINNKITEFEKELATKLTSEQKVLVSKFTFLKDRLKEEKCKQMFIYRILL